MPESLKGKRDRAIIAVLLGCGLRRREVADLSFDHLQRREDRCAIVDLAGKGGHMRTVPVPEWVKRFLDEWFTAARIASGKLFRCVCRSGTVWGNGMTEKVVWPIRYIPSRPWLPRPAAVTCTNRRQDSGIAVHAPENASSITWRGEC